MWGVVRLHFSHVLHMGAHQSFRNTIGTHASMSCSCASMFFSVPPRWVSPTIHISQHASGMPGCHDACVQSSLQDATTCYVIPSWGHRLGPTNMQTHASQACKHVRQVCHVIANAFARLLAWRATCRKCERSDQQCQRRSCTHGESSGEHSWRRRGRSGRK